MFCVQRTDNGNVNEKQVFDLTLADFSSYFETKTSLDHGNDFAMANDGFFFDNQMMRIKHLLFIIHFFL